VSARVKSARRFTDHKEGNRHVVLAADHPAAIDGTTMFMRRRIASHMPQRLLKSGQHSRKIGSHVVKGRWSGQPIYTLTLEERATCPRSCGHWLNCYGNKMNWSERIQADPHLAKRLMDEVEFLAQKHPHGFVVRLHVLGDFFSASYVTLWSDLLRRWPRLNIFGYTAWQPDTDIGRFVGLVAAKFGRRFSIRYSDGPEATFRTVSVKAAPDAGDAIVCPAQTGRSDCCGTCALCWSTSRPIAFLEH
jgi:hypothetical protein